MHVRVLFTRFLVALPPRTAFLFIFLRACIRNKEEHINFDFWLLLHPAKAARAAKPVQKESPRGAVQINCICKKYFSVFPAAILAIQNLFY